MLLPYNAALLYDKLKELEVIDLASLEAVYNEHPDDSLQFEHGLLDKDLIDEDNLGTVISDILNIPYISLEKVYIQDEILNILPQEFAAEFKIITFRKDDDGLCVASPFPNQPDIFALLSKKVQSKVKVFYTRDRDIDWVLSKYEQELKDVYGEILARDTVERVEITTLLNTLLDKAYDNKASDIHLEPKDGKALIRFRVDGILKDITTLPSKTYEQLVNKIKVESKLRTDEHASAQDGKMRYLTGKELLDIRVSFVPTVHGENCVLRLLTSHVRQYGMNNLGLSDNDLLKVTRAFKKPYGMILSTGPTGSGKTTSMYSILKELNTRAHNITTIEDPVEYDITGINQIQVNTKTNLTFAEGLRSILRQDPDIIFVGEIRDVETAGIAINSAMTGHLVLSTLHTNDASTAFPRLLDMHVEPFLVASTVNVVVAQRLVRKICENCKVSYTKNASDVDKISGDPIIKKLLVPTKKAKEIRLYKGKGCKVCQNSGYLGRVGVFEVLEVTENIRDLIAKSATASEIAKQAVLEGMTTMVEDGVKKALNGVTTIDEILRVAKS